MNWGDASVNITGDATADSLVFAANTANFDAATTTFDGAVSIANTVTPTADPALDVTGNVDVSGDLDVDGSLNLGGDQLSLGTLTENNAGRILIGQYNGTDATTAYFSSETVGGDASLGKDGVLTIINGAIDEPKMDISNGPTGGDCLKYLSGVLTWQACSGGGGGDGVGTDGLPDVLANDNSANSLKITDLADPTANQDAATKKYVDDSLGSLASDRIQDLDNNTFIEVDTTDDGLTDSIVFTTNGTTRLTFDKVGNADYNGGAGAFYFSRNSGANTAPIVIQNAFGGGAGITFGNGGNVWAQVLGLPTDDLVFNTDVTERARFTAAGDLLIGTNTAAGSAILQMDSTSKGILIPRMTLAERNAIGTPANGLVVFATDAGDAGLLQFYDGTQWVDVGGGGANTGGLWTDLGGDRIHYGDAGTEQVGIGTDNPVTTLDVNGGIRVGSVSGADAPTYLSLASLSDTDVSSASDGQYLTYNTGSGNWEAQSLTGAAVPDGSLDWDKFVDAMTLDTTTTIDMDTNSANLNFDSDTFVIDSADDRIGIGTSSPAHELHVIGNIAIPRGNTYGVNHLGTYTDLISLDSANNRVYGSLGSNTRSRMLILNNGQMNLQTNAQDIIFSSKALNTESARITGNGNILVGTTTEDTSALLNLNSTTSGFLTPRMNNTQRDAIASPATSLLIFSVTDNEYQYNAGTPASPNWVPMSGSACADPTPDAFDFSNLANQTISSVVASNIVQITGVSCAVTVSSSGDASTQLQSCSDATCSTVIQGWSSSVQINNGEYVQARLTTSSTPGATSTTTITIGSASDSWSVSTSGGDCSVANPIPGTVCADGTVYAGKTVDGNVKMYVTRCDEGMSWNGSVCTGTRVYPKWATNGNTSDDSGGGGTVSGFTNTYTLNALVNTNSPFPMADRCATLTANGHSDWYLPATQEYVTILGNKDAIGYFNNTATYFASNQSNVVSALAIRASDQTSIAGAKINTSEVRCARKDGALPPAGTPGGTDGHVQYNEGGNLNGNANFVWDYTNNNLGIGTDTPAAALDVTGNTGEATIIARATDISVPFFQAYGDLDGNPNAPFMNISVVNSTSDRIVVDFEQERAWLQSPEFRFNYLGSDSNSGSQFLFTGNAAGSRLIASDRAQSMVQVSGGFEQTGTAAMDAFIINPSIYTTGDGTTGSGNNLLRVANTGVDQFVIDTDGKVGIGTNAPDASASLDIASTSRGFLTPRMTTTERDAIATPATGLMVYNTTSNTFDYYDGAAWASFASSAGTANALSDTGDGNTSIDVDTDNADTNNTTVFTNAGTQSMIIDATGDVGIGTMADPSEVLHVARTGQDPTIRIQNDGSANSTAIAITDTIANRNSTIRWTTGGNSERAKISAYMGSSGASPNMSLSTGFNTQKTSLALKSPVIDTQNIAAASISYTTDLPTSGNDTGLLISKTDTASNGISLLINAQTDSTTQFSVDDSGIGYFAGNVGIGNASPDVALDVTGDIEYTGTLTDVSDRRLKDNITPLNKHGALIDRINQIETVSFVMKDDAKKRTEFGVIAQQLETIFPELVHTAKDEMGTKSVNYVGLIAPMIEATKELKAENDALKAEIATMKSGQDEIMASLASMQDDMNGLKLHTGFGIEKANLQTLAIMLLMMILGGSCVMIATRIRRHS